MSSRPKANANPLPEEPEPVNPADLNQDGTTASEGGGPGIGYGGRPQTLPPREKPDREEPDKTEPDENPEI